MHSVDYNNKNCLHFLISNKREIKIEILKFFLKNQIDIYSPSSNGHTPTILSITENKPEILFYLLPIHNNPFQENLFVKFKKKFF